MSGETGLAYDRAREEAYQERAAQAHRDNYEYQCDECGDWADEDDIAVYRDQNLCPTCHRGYVLGDFEQLAKEIKIAFGGKTGGMAEELLAAMKNGT
jgi:hypothetical protein